MKLVIAVIKPHKLDTVRDAVAKLGISGLTVSESKGFGRQQGHTEMYRGAEYVVDFVPKVTIQIAVEDGSVEQVSDTIIKAARTGAIGDGKVFVCSLEDAVRVRTGESGSAALQ